MVLKIKKKIKIRYSNIENVSKKEGGRGTWRERKGERKGRGRRKGLRTSA